MALALCIPDAQVNLYFILPIRMKWMLLIYIVDLVYEMVTYFRYGPLVGFYYSTEIIFALVNLALFFLFVRNPVSRQQKKRRREFQQQYRQRSTGWQNNAWNGAGGGRNPNAPRHKCAICGRTELDDPNLTFRYCSKCTGNREYCQDHLFTHEHR